MEHESFLRPPLHVEKLSWERGLPSQPSYLYLESIFMRKKLILLPKAMSIYACRDCFALTKLTWLGEPECLFDEKLAELGW